MTSTTTSQFIAELAHKGVELWVEGERLRYRARPGAMTPSLLAELGQRKAELLQALHATNGHTQADPAQRHAPFPLTDIQYAYWVGRSASPSGANVAAHGYLELELSGLDLGRFEWVWQQLIARHEMLRAVIGTDGRQRILPEVSPFRLEVLDLSAQPPEEVARRLEQLREQLSHQVLPTDRWPLFDLRATLLAEGRVRLHIGIDLLIADAASLLILLRESLALYREPGRVLPALELSFRDCVLEEHAARDSEPYRRSLEYWRQRLPELPPAPELPLAQSPEALPRLRFVRRSATLEREQWSRLADRAKAHGLTPSMMLCAAYGEVLATWSRHRRFTLNLTLFNRLVSHPQVDSIVGDFTSGLLLGVDATRAESFVARALRLQRQFWKDLEHSRISSVQVLRELSRRQGSAPSALMPVVFTSILSRDAGAGDEELLAGLRKVAYFISQTPQVWLDHQAYELGGSLVLNWDAVEELFPPGLLDDMFSAYLQLLRQLAEEPACWESSALSLVPEQHLQLFSQANSTQAPLSDALLHTLFAAQALQHPERPAVLTPHRQLSYGELSAHAALLSSWLRENGAHPGQLVAVVLEKGWEQVASVLGILASGAAYLPLEPALPSERLQALLQEAEVSLVLTHSALLSRLSWPEGLRFHCVDTQQLPEQPALLSASADYSPERLAYVIYTSGSTGRPKGVMIDHRGAVNTVLDINRRFSVGPEDRVLGLSSLSFDLSVFDIFGTLAAGAALVLPDALQAREPAHWAWLLSQYSVSVWNSVPALLEMMVEHASGSQGSLPASLRLFMLSGDWIPTRLPGQVHALLPSSQVVSLGGATEASIWSIFHPITHVDPAWKSIPYGKPLTNQQFYVLDDALQPRPQFVPGELYIAGTGLAQGYWKDEEKTRARFLTHPTTGQRLYRTGDFGRYLPDGSIEFLGREDEQVKVRGYRIELGEIEAALAEHPSVASCVVAALGEPRGHRRLVAYVVPHGSQPYQPDTLATFLRERLPEYMVPVQWVQLQVLPLTANGKVDRRSLPAPEAGVTSAEHAFAAPSTPLQFAVARVWQEVLGLERVGLDDHFFRLGGDSLIAAHLVSRLLEVTQVEVPLRTLFDHPTLRSLCSVLESLQAQPSRAPALPALPTLSPAPLERFQPFPLTDVQQAYWLGRSGAFELGNISTHIYVEVEATELSLSRLEAAWQALILRHDMLRAVILPEGLQQVLAEVPAYRIETDDLSELPEDPVTARLEATRERMSHQVLDVTRWPLFELRASLLPSGRTRIHLSMDVLLADGFSLLLLFEEWGALYRQPSAELPALPLSFRDYVLAERALADSPQVQRSRAYWWQRIPTLPPAPELPLAVSPSALQKPRFVRRSKRLPPQLWQALQARGRQVGLTPSSLLLAAYCQVLSTWSRSPRFTVNLTLFQRLPLHPDVNRIVGDFTSLTLLEADFSGPDSFSAKAQRLQQQLWLDLDHGYVGGIAVLREMARRKGNTPAALMPVVFTSALPLESMGRQLSFLDWAGELAYSISQTSQVWLDHQVLEDKGALVLNWDAVEELFPPGLLDDTFSAYLQLLQRLAEAPSSWDSAELSLVPEQHLRLVSGVNSTQAPLSDALLHIPFIAQALEHPERPAVLTPHRQLSYGELSAHAALLSSWLLENGARPGQLVAVVLEKGWEQVASVLGILASGAAYLPLEPTLPPERLHTLLQEAEVSLVLTHSSLLSRLSWPEGLRFHCVDTQQLPEQPALLSASADYSPERLAYVIYTSGSTGRPKGVMIDHRGAVNTVLDINRRFSVGPEDRVLGLSSLSFDLSVFDIFGTLAAGAALVLPDALQAREPAHWAQLLSQYSVSVWNSVPALLEMMVEHASGAQGSLPASLRLFMLSGDWIPTRLPGQVHALLPSSQVVSLGGATEASIWSIFHPITHVDPAWKSIPYGKPLTNQQFHVLDDSLRPKPLFVPGELYIAGTGLALGYWKDEEKTRARFLTHPATGQRLYRTGDFGRYLPDGSIEFLGREDEQVKVRGYRIELGEIETALAEHPAVSSCVVAALGEPRGHRRLVAYVVPKSQGLSGLASERQQGQSLWSELLQIGHSRMEILGEELGEAELESFEQVTLRLITVYLCRALQELGAFTTAGEVWSLDSLLEQRGILQRYRRWLRRSLELLASQGLLRQRDEEFSSPLPLPQQSTEPFWEELSRIPAQEVSSLLAVIRRSGEQLSRVLRGEVQAVEMLFPGGSATDAQQLYQSVQLHQCNEAARDMVQALVASLGPDKHLRILELGAGVGSTTRYLLPALPPQRTTYVYTDISRYFLQHGRTTFADYPFLQFNLLDAEKEPQSQGYTPHSFDLIVASNVVHATRSIREALQNARALLAPGGLLLMLEDVRFLPLHNMVMGLQQGFDRAEDTELRPRHGLLSPTQWLEVLRQEGFEAAEVLEPSGRLAKLLGLCVVIARLPDGEQRQLRFEELAAFLRQKLPEYMVPAQWVQLQALPLTANGKVDRRSLPAPEAEAAAAAESSYVAPSTPLQLAVAQVWQEVLGVERVGLSDHFFRLGGDSLLAAHLVTRLREVAQVEVPLRTLFDHPTLVDLCSSLESLRAQPSQAPALPALPTLSPAPHERFQPFPLTDVQQAYWLGRSGAFELGNVSTHVYFEFEATELSLARLEAAWQALILRHDMLRAIFLPEGLQQVLAEVPAYRIEAEDLRELPEDQVAARLEATRERMSHQVLELSRWPLFELRASLLPSGHTRIHLSMEVLLADGWSLLLLFEEWATLYRQPAAELPELPLSFRDYVLAERTLADSSQVQRSRAYWWERIATLPPAPELPLAVSPSALQQPRFVRRTQRLAAPLWQALQARGREAGLTPSSLLLAAYSLVLATWSRSPRFTVNLTLFQRLPLHPSVNNLVGDFTSLTLLEVDFSGPSAFAAKAQLLQQQLGRDLDHRYIDGVQVLREMARRKGSASSALMPVVFTSALPLESMGRKLSLPDWASELVYSVSQTPQVWLDHQVLEDKGALLLNWDAVDELFPQGLLDDMFSAYLQLLRRLAEEPACWESSALSLAPEHHLRLVSRVNSTQAPLSDSRLHTLFAAQALQHPERPAVLTPHRQLSYGELSAHAALLSSWLLEQGVRPGQLVAVVLEKGWEQVASVLGILASGAAYLPLEPSLPAERLHTLLQEAEVSLVLTHSSLLSRLSWPEGLRFHCVDTQQLPEQPALLPPSARQSPEHLAYVIYTSGSTGRPKGVMIDHRGAVNTVLDINRRFSVGPEDRVLGLSSLSFDLSVFDVFGTLAAGAALVLPDALQAREPAHWAQLLTQHSVSVWNSVPALLETVVEHASSAQGTLPASLRLFMLSGDWIPTRLPGQVHSLLPSSQVVSLGGATEASIWSIFHPITHVDPAWKSIPYGKPLTNQQFHVLDDSLRPKPLFVPGELYIAGTGLALGYWKDGEKTRARFLTHPTTGQRLYRTGDFGRYLPDGSIEFLGREDEQVKVRGYRIELGEIETALAEHPAVSSCVVAALGEPRGHRRLVAYVVPKAPGLSDLASERQQGQLLWAELLRLGRSHLESLGLELTEAELETFEQVTLRLVTAYVCRAFQELGVFTTAGEVWTIDSLLKQHGILPRYWKWLRRSLEMLAMQGLLRQRGEEFSNPSPLPQEPTEPLLSALDFMPAQEIGSLLAVIRRGGEHLLGVLRGEVQAVEMLFPSGSATDAQQLYQSVHFHQCHEACRDMVRSLVASLGPDKHLRILELGAGVGATTQYLLPVLPPERTTYVYTDISRYFLQLGRTTFADYSFLQFDLLDAEKDPQSQGYTPRSFDLIVASNVVHATRSIREALQNARSLLAPGGLLLMLEGVRFLPMHNMVMGLQQGFDRAEDSELRPRHPLLSPAQWLEVLRQEGFEAAEVLEPAGRLARLLGLCVVMARLPDGEQRQLRFEELAAFLGQKLPEYMVPAQWVQLQALPLTANGKVDRRSLPAPEAEAAEAESSYVAPVTPLQSAVAQVWREVLGVERVGLSDHFFRLGGDSLLAAHLVTRLREVAQVEVPLRTLFDHPTLVDLCSSLESLRAQPSQAPALPALPILSPAPHERFQPFPLTDVQQAYWLGRSGAFELGNVSTHIYAEFEAKDLSLARLEAAWQALILRHDMLRAVIRPEGLQQVLAQVPAYRIEVEDLRELLEGQVTARIEATRERMSHQVLDVARWPLFELRASLLPSGRLRLHLSIDILIADGWSLVMLFEEWAALYRQPSAELPALPLSFRDYVLAERALVDSPQVQRSRAYWWERVATLPPAPELPLARSPSSLSQPRFVRRAQRLAPPLWQALQARGREAGLTPSSLLLAAYSLVLATWSRSPRLTVNLTLFQRLPLHPSVNHLVGDFTSLTLLEVDFSGADSFSSKARRLQQQLWLDLDHRYVSGIQVLREMARRKGSAPSALMPVIFTSALPLESMGHRFSSIDWAGDFVYGISQTSQVWLDHQVLEDKGALVLNWDAVEELFPPGLLDDMFSAYVQLLYRLAEEPACWESPELPLTPAHHLRLVSQVNSTQAPLSDSLLHTLFAAQALAHPERPAVLTPHRQLSYGELSAHAALLSSWLLENGARPGQLVAVVLEKGWEQVASVLGILASGAAYLPLEPSLPAERLHTLLQEAEVSLVLTHSALLSRLSWPEGLRFHCVDTQQLPAQPALLSASADYSPERLAYVIYTSGSTGRPKGVMIDHRGAVNTVLDINRRFSLRHEDRVLGLSSLSFDLSVFDVFGTLAAGAALVLPDALQAREPAHWAWLLSQHSVSVWNSVPALLEMLVEHASSAQGTLPASLRLFMLSGDWIPTRLPGQVRSLLPDSQVVSLGGATEASIWSIFHPITHVDPAWKSIPYGKPLTNQQFHVLDDALRPKPLFVPGELYIAGTGLALGYWKDEEKTRARFLTHPTTSQRLYRTGDFGRYLPDGSIEFLGREDEQVKVRGYRIELGEIETALAEHPAVSSCVVAALGEPRGHRRLVAYVVPKPSHAYEPDTLAAFLMQRLPEYMLPAQWVQLQALPLTANGKVDRRSLPATEAEATAAEGSYIAPSTPLQLAVAQAWQEVLSVERVGLSDHFFRLGGDSLLAAHLVTRLRETVQVEVPLRTLFNHPTLAELCSTLESLQAQPSQAPALPALPTLSPAPLERFKPFPLTDVQQAYWLGRGGAFELGNVSTHIYLEFEAKELSLSRLEAAWQALILRHDMLRAVIRPEGVQQVLAEVPAYRIEIDDLRELPEVEATARIEATRERMSHQVLDVARWPLFELRASLLPSGHTRLHLSIDVLIADGWSLMLLFEEWATLYQQPSAELPELPLGFRDYVLAERTLAELPQVQSSRAYWWERIASLPPAPELPLARSPSSIAQPRFVRRAKRLAPPLWQALQARGREAGLTPSSLLLAAYSLVLATWSRSPRFTVNLTLFQRLPLHPDVNRIVGDFTSLTLLEVDFSGSSPFTSKAQRLQRQLGRDLDHRYVSGIQVLREMARRKGNASSALMPVVFTSALPLENLERQRSSLDWAGELVYSISQTSQVWLDHQAIEDKGWLLLNWDAVEELFSPELLDDMFSAYVQLLHRLVEEPACWQSPELLLTPAHHLRLVSQVNSTQAPLSDSLLHTLFAAQALAHPGRPAVLTPYRQLSYGELSAHAALLSSWLLEQGVRPGQLVAVVLEKGWEQVASVLGILASGAAYLPLEPSLPAERLHTLLQEAEVSLVLTHSALLSRLSWPEGLRFHCVDTQQLPAQPPLLSASAGYSPERLAYVIYTSGSTGRPKGVMIDHRGAVNTVLDINRRFSVSHEDRVLGLSSLSFDLSVFDVFGTLAAGAALVLPDALQAREPAHWAQLLSQHSVSVWNSVPALLEMVVEHASSAQGTLPASLRLFMLSGDWIPTRLPGQVHSLLPSSQVVSLGGATEASIWSIFHPITHVDPAWKSIPYGKPLTNQQFHVLDDALRPKPLFVPGELYIAGTGLALGYWKDGEKTRARFLTHPTTGQRLYRTGDFGRYLPDGSIEFLGREDEQVKVRGYRIELGEIETALAEHPAVSSCVVAALGEPRGHRRLVAYVVPKAQGLSDLALERQQGQSLWNELLQFGRSRLGNLGLELTEAELETFEQVTPRLVAAYLCRAFRELGVFTTAGEVWTIDSLLKQYGILPRYWKWLQRSLEMLAAQGLLLQRGEEFSSPLPLPEEPTEPLWDALSFMPTQEASSSLSFVRRSGEQLSRLIRGDVHAVEMLFPGGSAADAQQIYRAGQLHQCNEACRDMVQALVASLGPDKHLRILEIGAGIGSTTQYLLPVLPPARTTYVYTDISRYFLQLGRTTFADYPFLQFNLLDAEKDPQSQGYTPHSFDLIVASSVLHATRDIRETLRHARSLLAPGGVLLMLEETRFLSFHNLTMGLQQGFDRAEDAELRPRHPLLSIPQWLEVLRQEGFEAAESLEPAGRFSKALGICVVMARLPAGEQRQLRFEELAAFLRQKLPEYMVPAQWVQLQALPLTTNGKVDRRSLPALETEVAPAEGSYVAPSTPLQSTVAQVWREVLGVERVGLNDHFFRLGGDSLLAAHLVTRLREVAQVDVPLRTLFEHPTLAELCSTLESQQAQSSQAAALPALPTLSPAPHERFQPFPLTDVQQAYWLGRGGAFELGNVSTHIYIEIEATELSLSRLEAAWQALIHRHDMLRAVILPEGVQQVLAEVPAYRIEAEDLRELPEEQVAARLEVTRERMSHQVLEVTRWPLFELRASLLPSGRLRLHLSVDILVADGWSLMLLFSEWAALYRQPPAELPALPLSFRDYVLAERALADTAQVQRSRAYWWQRIATLPPAPELPLAVSPSALQQPRFVRRSQRLAPQLWQALQARGRQAGLTPSSLLLAAYSLVLATWGRSPRFTVNLTLFQRLPLHPEVDRLVGDFTSLTLLEVDFSGSSPFTSKAQRLQQQLGRDLDHRYVSGVQVLREMARRKGSAPSALMPVVFTSALPLENMGRELPVFDWAGELVYSISQTSQVWLDHQVLEDQGSLVLNWDAVEELFSPELLDDMFSAYVQLLHRLAEDPACWQSPELSLAPAHHLQLVSHTNATQAPVSDSLLHTLFAAKALEHPERPAVLTPHRQLSYGELSAHAALLSSWLLEQGVRPGQLVAVVLEKGWEQVASVLGILASGAAYLPLEPTLPPERLHTLLQEAEVSLVLTHSELLSRLSWPEGLRFHCVDTQQLPAQPALLSAAAGYSPERLAYVIYTSGSTGRPKGVMIDHRGAVNTVLDINRRFSVGPEDRVLGLSSLSFDLSVFDVFGTLAAGAALVLPDASQAREPAHWAQLLSQHSVSVWNSVPALLEMMVEHVSGSQGSLPASLRLFLLSGDWIPTRLPGQVHSLLPSSQVVSLGGATEASIWSIFHPITHVDAAWKSIPYGKPLTNQQFHVLDDALRPRPLFVPGELYIAGTGLALGYWKDEEKTRARFLFHPTTGQRLYRTGDFGRYLPDGSIEFLGREDEQVKVRGYRIELGEIEAALAEHPSVSSCVVAALGEPRGHRRLVAYVVPSGSHPYEPDTLAAFLRGKLPEYMVPTQWVQMQTLPLTANGKVDRRSLPAPEAQGQVGEHSFVAPRNEVEAALAEIWARALGVERVGVEDNFFALGGDSLLAARVVQEVAKTWSISLSLRDLLSEPTVEALALHVEEQLIDQLLGDSTQAQ